MTTFHLRDIEDLFEEIKQIAQKNSPDKNWSGLTYGGIPWVMGRTLAEISQFILYNVDMRSLESYVDTAKLKSSLRLLASLYEHQITERTGATTTLSITATSDVTIPKGSRFASSTGEIFSTIDDLTLSASSSLTGNIDVVHGLYEQKTYVSSGTIEEEVTLNYTNILLDQLNVFVNGTQWTRVVNFARSSQTDQHYVVIFNDDETAFIQFPDGVYGQRLPADATVLVDVFYGGGPSGNGFAIADIDSLKSVFTGSNYISSISNSTATSGGGTGDSITKIKRQIQSLNTYKAGIISSDRAADIITANKTYIHDAIIDLDWVVSGSATIPTATVYAFPINSSITDLSSAQKAELTAFLETRGEVGVSWVVDDAVDAPIQTTIEVLAANRSLQDQTKTLIQNSLNTDSGAAFSFDELSFDQNIKQQNLLNTINDIDNVASARITELGRIPQTLVLQGLSTDDDFALDLELGEQAEDGYMLFSPTTTTDADADFFLPVQISAIGTNEVVSLSSNWLKQKHEYDSGSDLDDSGNDYIKANTKLEFKQSTRVWKTNEFAGSNWNQKYMLYISWTDENGDTQTAWYHIASNTYSTITTTENAASPVSGTAINTLANASYSNIVASIVRDLSQGTLVGGSGNSYIINHNTSNTIYTSESTVLLPLNKYAHIRFPETSLDITNGSYASSGDVLRMRLDATETFTVGSAIAVYTTPRLAKQLQYKNFREVFSLSNANINIIWI